jgi:hypothetical protein
MAGLFRSLLRRRRLPRAAKDHCPLCQCDLIGQAYRLADCGYYIGRGDGPL